MDDKLHEVYTCLRIMDMLLYKTAYEPETIAGFKSIKEMAIYFRAMLDTVLPNEYQYKQ